MSREQENNQVTLSGEIVRNFEFGHEVFDEKFYVTIIKIERKSRQKDIIPIMVSERLTDVKVDWTGKFVRASGQFHSYNRYEGKKNRLILSVFIKEFEECGKIPFIDDKNKICLDGYICKEPIYRKTPLGREITDILLAVNRLYGKSDYIPCITWGRSARFAGDLEIGTRLQIEGRIQSREYQKRISDDEYETRTAYEVSVSKLTVVEETEE